VRIGTWNVNSLRVRLPQVIEWLAREPLDVLAMQETKLIDEDFPHEAFGALGYHAQFCGQKSYNGVALLTRTPCEAIATAIPAFDDAARRVLAGSVGALRIVNLYVPNGQSVGSDKYAYKLSWLAALKDWLQAQLARHERLIVLGDFNIAPTDADVHDPDAWAGSVHVSEPERAALRELCALGLSDVFRHFEQPAQTFSWWDYRMGAFRRNHGLRIDLVLASAPLMSACRACRIDREPRRAERPSDHAPVIAEFSVSC
jgi:exodeoxyribonuclease-3